MAFGYKCGLRSNLRAPDFSKTFLGEHVPRHPSVRTHHQRCPPLPISRIFRRIWMVQQSNKYMHAPVHIIPLLNEYSQIESLPFLILTLVPYNVHNTISRYLHPACSQTLTSKQSTRNGWHRTIDGFQMPRSYFWRRSARSRGSCTANLSPCETPIPSSLVPRHQIFRAPCGPVEKHLHW